MASAFELVVMPAVLPFFGLYYVLSYLLACALTLTVVPSVILAKKLYWACPFIPHIWRSHGAVAGTLLKLAFETSYSINVLKRLLTLPFRPHLPDFYIVGFPKAGTTTLAQHLKRHPAIDGIVGLPWHDALSKESHFMNGVFGPNSAQSVALYRSFFPTVFRRWWAEVVRGVNKWICFDACPVPACLPYTAQRIANMTPDAKIIFMLRDPTPGVFSAEIMLRNMGFPLDWSLMEEAVVDDPRFMITHEEQQMWEALENLRDNDPLPDGLPKFFYSTLASYLKCGRYAERVKPFLQHFPRDNLMFIDFKEFVGNTEEVVKEVLQFVGAETSRYRYKELPPGMKTDYKGRRMHPTVKAKLQSYFWDSNSRLYTLLGRDFCWGDIEC